ncbi:MAG: hypothetical protein V3V00_07845 [Saprospiraceae bacterium]
MIDVFASLSVVHKLTEAFQNLENSNTAKINLNTLSTGGLLDENRDGLLAVGIINLDAVDQFLDAINGLQNSKAITIIDNGSTAKLKPLLENNTLITRVLGIQSHIYQGTLDALDPERIFRLKEIRENSDISEIVLRTSDVAIFNMNAIRKSDQCGSLRSNTTGITIEESCQIAKFIGASDLINEVYFIGLNQNNDAYDMMSINLANMLWYLSEGANLRKIDQYIADSENLVFSVMASPLDHELQFVNSSESGRWWVKVPTEESYMYMACSKRDYEMACNNEISLRIKKALETEI